MQRILLSLAVLVAVGGAVAASTGAFFSDTETSTGNSFTAGAIDLKVDDTQHYDGLICQGVGQAEGYTWQQDPNAPTTSRPELIGQTCTGTWELKDLAPTLDKFFNFTDMKPGDSGENTVSLHIDNNPAWACATISNIHNDDNDCTSPEAQAGSGDPECIAAGSGANLGANNLGELGQSLSFVVWNDNGTTTEGETAGNNILNADETVVAQGTLPLASTTFPIADSVVGGTPISQSGTSYLGAAWCLGTFTSVVPGQPLVCDGTSVGNGAQTDSYTADFALNVVQSRNNSSYVCSPSELQEIPR